MQKVNILENIPGHSRSRPVRRVMQGPGEMVAGWKEKEVRAGLWEGWRVRQWGVGGNQWANLGKTTQEI